MRSRPHPPQPDGAADAAPHAAPHAICGPCLTACALSSWYPAFRRCTFRTAFVPLSDAHFLAYLDADGIVLPAVAAPANLAPHDPRRGGDDGSSSSSSSSSGGGATALPPAFPALERAITAAIDELGGAAMPKLDWTAPADATWLAPNGSTKCSSAGEVFLLLKGSDLARYDLDLAARLAALGCARPAAACAVQVGDGAAAAGEAAAAAAAAPPSCFTPVLALRAWYALHPAGEFRCFVRHRRLAGVCQRHTGQSFDFLDAGALAEAQVELGRFFAERVVAAFPLRDYVFDAYRDRRGRWWLVDFAPFGYDTDSLLFSWDELSGQAAAAAAAATTEDNGGDQAAPAATLACCEHALDARGGIDGLRGAEGAGEDGAAQQPGGGAHAAAAAAAPAFRMVADAPPIGFPPLAQHRFPNDLLALAAAMRHGGGGGGDGGGGAEGLPGGHLNDDAIERMRTLGLFQGGGEEDEEDDGDAELDERTDRA